MKYKWYYKIPFFAMLGALALIGLGYLVMYLWNMLIPQIFNGPVITFWQAIGLFVLTKILLHTFGFNRHHSYYMNRGRYYHWKARMEEKLASMTPEERKNSPRNGEDTAGQDTGSKNRLNHIRFPELDCAFCLA